MRTLCNKLQKTASRDELYWIWATLGEAQLILGNEKESIDAFMKRGEPSTVVYLEEFQDNVVGRMRWVEILTRIQEEG